MKAHPIPVIEQPLVFDILGEGYFHNAEQTKIPLKRVGNLFLIEAKMDDLVGNFVLDLGAPYLVLNATYFRDYQIHKDQYAGTLLTGTNYVKKTSVNSLQFQDLAYYQLKADITDLGEIENKHGIKILGLMGVNLFHNYVLDLDVLNQQLILHQQLDALPFEMDLFFETPIVLQNGIASIEANIGKVELNLSLDTAAETNILSNNLPRKSYNNMKILRPIMVIDANGGKTEVLFVIMDGIHIGNHALKKMQTMVLNLKSMSRAYGRKIDGMLGFPFFAQGRVIIDFKKKHLWIYTKRKLMD